MNKVLITGCPKSGTKYTTVLLKHLGLDFGHEEQTGKDGQTNWMLAPGKKSKPLEGPSFKKFKDAIILHQIRHPLDTISSCTKIGQWKYICNYIPVEAYEYALLKSMNLYFYWNRMAERLASWTYRIESLPEIWELFCEKINHPELTPDRDKIKEIPTNINTAKPYKRVTWDILDATDKRLSHKIFTMAYKHGYVD